MRQLETAARYIYTNLLPLPLVVLGLAAVLGQSHDAEWLALWGVATVATWSITILTIHVFLRHGNRVTQTGRWTVVICAAIFVSSGTFALVSPMFWIDGDRLNNVLLYVVLAAALAGAGAQAAPSTPVAVANMSPYASAFLYLSLVNEPHPTNLMLAGLQLCYVALVWLTSRAVWQLAREMLCLRDERRTLVGKLQRALAETVKAKHSAEAASRAKSEFLANMSHELRTPLNAVLGFSEVIKDRTFGKDAGDRYAEYAGHIHFSGQHLLCLINDILDLSKIEAGKRELDESTFDLTATARDVRTFVEPQAGRKGLQLMLDATAPVVLRADERALRQVMVNLLSNAVKFTPEGGRITLRVAAGIAGVLIEVRDTGIGISREELDKVLERYAQARHDIVTTPERGTGLGLAIVKGLVELHGGEIRIASTPGSGTTVTVELPAARRASERSFTDAA